MVGRMSRRNKRTSVDGENQHGDATSFLRSPEDSPPPGGGFEGLDCFNSDHGQHTASQSMSQCLSPSKFLLQCDDLEDHSTLFPCDPALSRTGSSDFNTTNLNLDFNMDHMPLDTLEMDQELSLQHFTIPGVLPPSPDYTTSSLSTSLASSVKKVQHEGRRFPHITAMSKILRVLETHIQAKTHTLDEILRVNKACMSDLVKIMAMDEYRACRCCNMIASSALDLIIALFEEVANAQEWGTSNGQRRPGKFPILQFGVFELDPEEQMAMTKRILKKELQKCLQIVQGFSGEFQGSNLDNCKRLVGQWSIILKNRIEHLLSSLGT